MLAREKYNIALQHRSVSAIVSALIERGAALKTDHPDSAYLDLTLALKLANRFNLKTSVPVIFLTLAGIYASSADLKTAVAFYDSAKISALRIGDTASLVSALNLLGTLHFDLHNINEAKVLFTESYKTAMSCSLTSQAGVALGNLARFSDEPDSAVRKMQQAIVLLQQDKNNEHDRAWIYINIGNRMSNPDSAIRYYETAISAMQGMADHPVIVMEAINNMAYSLLEKGKPEVADELLKKKAIPIALARKDYDWLATLYDTHADVKESQANFKEAFRLEKSAIKTRMLAESEKASQQVRLLLMLLDVRNKDVKITTSKLQIKEQQQSITKLKISLLLLFVLIITVGIGTIVIRQRSKIRLQRQEILSIQRQAAIADEERTRLSRLLHDLTGMIDKKMLSKIVRMNPSNESIRNKAEAEWKGLFSAVHSLSYRLNRDMFAEIPLKESIQNLVDEYNQIGEAEICFSVGAGTVFPKQYKSDAGYIIQELLNNALKHGGACKVELQMTCEAGNYYLFYNDDGPGFDYNPNSHKSMGINNIFERAKLMEGKATLISSPGNGTRWIIALPYHEQDEQEQVG